MREIAMKCRICRDEATGCHICVLRCKRFFRKSIASYAYRSAKNCTIEYAPQLLANTAD